MLKKLRLYTFLCMLLLAGGWGKAQTYTIPDVNFRNYLATLSPSVLNSSQQLVIANAKAYTGVITCSGLNIQDISGLQFFQKITMLNCSGNQITFLPSLDSLKLLKQMWVYDNKLTSVPNVNQIATLEVFNVKNNLLTSLPSLDGLTSLKNIDCSQNNLSALPDLSTLVNLEELYTYNTGITTVPSLTKLTRLKLLNIQGNRLTSLPDISKNSMLTILQFDYNQIDTIPSLSHLTALSQLIFTGNKVRHLPDLSSNTQLTLLYGASNALKTIPDLSGLSNLTEVLLDHNRLSFEQLLPSAQHPKFNTVFHIQPQDTIVVNKTLNIVEGAPYSIDLGFDEGVSGSTYTWYKNKLQVASTTAPVLSYTSADKSQAGSYTASIINSNPALNGITLYVKAASVSIAPCITVSAINYEIVANDCAKGATISLDNSAVTGANTPFTYYITPLNNQQAITSQATTISNIMAGSYNLSIKDVNGCGISFRNYLYIPAPSECTESFTPNGDGLQDTYFIDEKGTARIYDKNGVLIRTLTAPTHWDGRDDSGKTATMGYYLIIVDEKGKKGVVLID